MGMATPACTGEIPGPATSGTSQQTCKPAEKSRLHSASGRSAVSSGTRGWSKRPCGPRGKRQLKWVLLGFLVGFVPILLTSMLALAAPELWWLYEASLILVLAIPICLFVALVRFNLFDVDRLLTVAATYSVIGTVSLAGVFLVVPRASAAASGWIEPEVSQPALALALAGLASCGGVSHRPHIICQTTRPSSYLSILLKHCVNRLESA